MNEKLLEFYKESFGEDPVYPGSVEKFAELILFECIKIAVFKGDVTTGQLIKEHFGIN